MSTKSTVDSESVDHDRVVPPVSAPSLERVEHLLHKALGEVVAVHGVWRAEALRTELWYAIFSYPAYRVSGLEHWRDTVELVTDDGVPIVADEAWKSARLLLRAEPRTSSILKREPIFADSFGENIMRLAGSLGGDGAARFEALNRWLQAVRVGDLTSASG